MLNKEHMWENRRKKKHDGWVKTQPPPSLEPMYVYTVNKRKKTEKRDISFPL